MKFFAHYTKDKSCYYITTSSKNYRPQSFLSVDKIPGAHTIEMEQSGGFGPTYIEIKKTNGEVYCRKVFGFWCWDMKTDFEVEISLKNDVEADLIADYAFANHWKIDFRSPFEKLKDAFKKGEK